MVNKISIIGAGSVGSTLAFHLLSSLDLKTLCLIDVVKGLAKGIAFDLGDCRQFLNFMTEVTGSDRIEDANGSDIIVITAGLPRKEGMTRQDLLNINRKITADIARVVKKVAPRAIVVIVTNPLDLIVYSVRKVLGFKRERVIGMGMGLDSARLSNLIYEKLRLDPGSLQSLIIGPHSKDMIPLLAYTKYKNISITDLLNKTQQAELKNRVKLRGKEIVDQLKNRSAYFAPSLACARLVSSIAGDRRELIPVSAVLEGEYGISGIAMGVPCIVGKNGIEKILEVPLDAESKKAISAYKASFKQCMKSQ